MNYSFNKVTEPNKLRNEINASSITVALDNITVSNGVTTVIFKASLSVSEEATLTTIVDNHVATPVPNDVTSVDVKSTLPFAYPSHRTQWDATGLYEVVADEIKTIDFVITQDRTIYGGVMVFHGVQIGDWFECMIMDDELNPTIPEAHRPLTENWPILNRYIRKYNLPEGNSTREINTYPLATDLKAGWIIRIKYHANSTAGTRRVSANFYLLKKL